MTLPTSLRVNGQLVTREELVRQIEVLADRAPTEAAAELLASYTTFLRAQDLLKRARERLAAALAAHRASAAASSETGNSCSLAIPSRPRR